MMTFKPSKVLIKQMLSSHSVIGLVTGAFMYLICLTGTLAVLGDYIERWEQPEVPEYSLLSEASISKSVDHYMDQQEKSPEALYVVLPTESLPRAHLSDREQEWYLDIDGALIEEPVEGWAYLIEKLHVSLYLPETIGLILVSAFGVMLLSLIISGVLAHSRIFKDAFRLRLGGNRRLEQADIHNRLSVWGLPFHFMIALTGAFFGLAGILVITAASVFYDGDREALIADIYGKDPVVSAPVQPLDFASAFKNLKIENPQATPIYLIVNKPGTTGQNIEIAATLPGRLSYAEMYRFAADGSYLGNQGLATGPVARQIIYSVYRLHFGSFGGWPILVLYVLAGIALTVISVSGINIWLEKRNGRTWVNDIWSAVVWGVPLAFALAAVYSVLLGGAAILGFVFGLLFSALLSLIQKDAFKSAALLQVMGGVTLLGLLSGYYLKFNILFSSDSSVLINGMVIITAIFLVIQGLRRLRKHSIKNAMVAA